MCENKWVIERERLSCSCTQIYTKFTITTFTFCSHSICQTRLFYALSKVFTIFEKHCIFLAHNLYFFALVLPATYFNTVHSRFVRSFLLWTNFTFLHPLCSAFGDSCRQVDSFTNDAGFTFKPVTCMFCYFSDLILLEPSALSSFTTKNVTYRMYVCMRVLLLSYWSAKRIRSWLTKKSRYM